MQSKSVNFQGRTREVGPALLDKIFAHNPYIHGRDLPHRAE